MDSLCKDSRGGTRKTMNLGLEMWEYTKGLTYRIEFNIQNKDLHLSYG
jgi:hypothetical protein